MTNAAKRPKAFISYAWTDDTHVERVLALAERLTEDGVEVVIDKWDLNPGQDAYKFMEKLVADPSVTHALMISNRVYVEKADARSGGAGAEAQIISPAIYTATDQEKFILVAFELDAEDKPYVPTFYKGRIYINLADDVGYESEYERLIRTLWGKPLHKRPKLGAMPAHLSETASRASVARSAYLRALEALKAGKPSANAQMREFRDQVQADLPSHRLESAGEDDFDDRVVESIEALRPLVDELQALLTEAARSQSSNEWFELYFSMLEDIQACCYRPPDLNRWYPIQFDNFRFIATEAFLISAAVLLKERRFELFRALTDRRYTSVESSRTHRGFTHDFSECSHHIGALEVRNERLALGRTSLFGDMLMAHRTSSPLSFANLAEADLMLFLRDSQMATQIENGHPSWWPAALMRSESRYAPTTLFARAESRAECAQVATFLGVKDATTLKALIDTVVQNRWLRAGRFIFGPDLKALTNYERLGIYA